MLKTPLSIVWSIRMLFGVIYHNSWDIRNTCKYDKKRKQGYQNNTYGSFFRKQTKLHICFLNENVDKNNVLNVVELNLLRLKRLFVWGISTWIYKLFAIAFEDVQAHKRRRVFMERIEVPTHITSWNVGPRRRWVSLATIFYYNAKPTTTSVN